MKKMKRMKNELYDHHNNRIFVWSTIWRVNRCLIYTEVLLQYLQ